MPVAAASTASAQAASACSCSLARSFVVRFFSPLFEKKILPLISDLFWRLQDGHRQSEESDVGWLRQVVFRVVEGGRQT